MLGGGDNPGARKFEIRTWHLGVGGLISALSTYEWEGGFVTPCASARVRGLSPGLAPPSLAPMEGGDGARAALSDPMEGGERTRAIIGGHAERGDTRAVCDTVQQQVVFP